MRRHLSWLTVVIELMVMALTAGAHLDFLRKKYEQLQQGQWNPDSRK